VCLIEPELRDKLGLDRDCIGQTIRIGVRNFRIIGVIEKRNDLQFGSGGQERFEIIIPFDAASKFQKDFWYGGSPMANQRRLSRKELVS